MKILKKSLRWFLLVLFMILASVGVGISGAIPVVENRKREPENEPKIEEVDQLGETSEKK